MERLYDLHASGNYDLIVVDTPPTRNAIDFLEAPARMADFFSSRLLRWLTAPARSRVVNFASKPFYTVADRILGSQFLQDIAEFFLLFQAMYDGFVERAEAVEQVLARPAHHLRRGVDARGGAGPRGRVLHRGAARTGSSTSAPSCSTRCCRATCSTAGDRPSPAGSRTQAPSDRRRSSPRPSEPPTTRCARVLHEVGASFLNFQVVAQREAETRAELAATPEVVAAVPYFETDIVDLAGLAPARRRDLALRRAVFTM